MIKKTYPTVYFPALIILLVNFLSDKSKSKSFSYDRALSSP